MRESSLDPPRVQTLWLILQLAGDHASWAIRLVSMNPPPGCRVKFLLAGCDELFFSIDRSVRENVHSIMGLWVHF